MFTPSEQKHFPLGRVLIRLHHTIVLVRKEADDPCIFEHAADGLNSTGEGPHGRELLIPLCKGTGIIIEKTQLGTA